MPDVSIVLILHSIRFKLSCWVSAKGTLSLYNGFPGECLGTIIGIVVVKVEMAVNPNLHREEEVSSYMCTEQEGWVYCEVEGRIIIRGVYEKVGVCILGSIREPCKLISLASRTWKLEMQQHLPIVLKREVQP